MKQFSFYICNLNAFFTKPAWFFKVSLLSALSTLCFGWITSWQALFDQKLISSKIWRTPVEEVQA